MTLLLAEKWSTLDHFADLARRDPEFQGFVLRHLDETVPADRLAAIAKNAHARCPSSQHRLCKLIERAATVAGRTVR